MPPCIPGTCQGAALSSACSGKSGTQQPFLSEIVDARSLSFSAGEVRTSRCLRNTVRPGPDGSDLNRVRYCEPFVHLGAPLVFLVLPAAILASSKRHPLTAQTFFKSVSPTAGSLIRQDLQCGDAPPPCLPCLCFCQECGNARLLELLHMLCKTCG